VERALQREEERFRETLDEGIKILHVDGLGGGDGGHRSPTDEVIESALRYRAQAPLIDEMMKEIGVENPNVARLGDIFRSARDAQSLAQSAAPAKDESDGGGRKSGGRSSRKSDKQEE